MIIDELVIVVFQAFALAFLYGDITEGKSNTMGYIIMIIISATIFKNFATLIIHSIRDYKKRRLEKQQEEEKKRSEEIKQENREESKDRFIRLELMTYRN